MNQLYVGQRAEVTHPGLSGKTEKGVIRKIHGDYIDVRKDDKAVLTDVHFTHIMPKGWRNNETSSD